jgi:hypothetical protein
MAESRLERARTTLPEDYQFGDAGRMLEPKFEHEHEWHRYDALHMRCSFCRQFGIRVTNSHG